jgi:hypothetical protein
MLLNPYLDYKIKKLFYNRNQNTKENKSQKYSASKMSNF